MARYGASLDLFVSGQDKVEKLLSAVNSLESAVGSLRKTPLELNLGNISKLIGQNENRFQSAGKKINSLYEERLKKIEKIGKLSERIARNDKILESGASSTRKQKAMEAIEEALNEQIDLQNELNRSIDRSNELTKARQRIQDNQAGLRAIRQQIGFAKVLADSYLEYGDARKYAEGKGFSPKGVLAKNETSIAGIKQQADTFELLANNARIASKEFNRFAIASELASIKAGKARQEKLGALAEAFSPAGQIGIKPRFSEKELTGARGAVGALVESYGGIVKSEAALSSYIAQASRLQSIVPFDSSEWNLLETVINDVNGELQQLEQRFKGLRGQSSNLAQAVADGIAPGIAAPRGRGPSQLLPQFDIKSASDKAKYYSKIEDQVSRLAGFEERIAQANLTQVQKVELRSRLDKAVSLLSENRLEDAKRETVEIEKQRMSLERMNRAGSDKPQGLAVELGGGAELRERNKYEAEQVRLRGQIAEATNTAAAAVQRLEAAQGRISMVQEFEEIQSGINSVSDKVDAFLEKDKRALRKFNQTLKETSATIKQVKQGVAVDLGGGAEVRERAKFEESTEKNLRRRNSILASGAIIEQGLFNLRSKGVNVDQTLEGLQRSLNAAKLEEFEITSKTLDALSEQVSLAGKYAQLQRTALAGQSGAGGKKAGPEGTGLEAALKKLEEARAARQKFLGSASPAEALDKIVREFNKGKPGSGAGANVVNTLLSEASAGVPKAAAAGEQLGKAVEDGLNDGLEIQSPSRVAIEAMLNVINTLVSTAKSGKAKVQAALEDLVAPKLGNVQKSPLLKSLTATTEDTIEKLSNFIGRASAKPSLYRPLARLAGPELLSGGAVPQAMQRKAFEAGKILPETRLLPLSERRLLRGSANAPGGGLESEVLRAAIKGVSGTGAFVGPLASSVRGQGAVASRLFPALSQGPAGLGGTGIFPVRPQPRVGAPGSAFPFQSYQMGSAQQFPVDKAINLLQKGATRSDANRALADAISRYRDAVNNFWEGEDSQFEAISKVVKSSAQVGGAKLARKFTESGRGAGLSEIADVVSGEKELGVSRFVGQSTQRISDSILNSIEPLAYSIGDSFKDGIDKIRNAVPGLVSRGLSVASGAIGGGGGRPPLPPGGGGGETRDPGEFGRRLSQAADQGADALLGLRELRDPSKATTVELEALSAVLKEFRNILDPTVEGFDRLEKQLRESAAGIDRQLERRDPNADFLTRQFGPRGGRAVSEGLIGGAFPLLFGQGLGASAGGAVGGALGGFAGGQLGFGLSLVGTALGTIFDTLLQKSDELASALAKPAENFDKLKEVAFISSRSLEKQIEKTLEYGNEVGASTLIQEEAIRKLGVSGVSNLSRLETESDRANRAFAELGQQMQAVTAGPLASVKKFFADVFGGAAAGGRVKALREGLTGDERKQFEADLQKRLKDVGVQRGFFGGEASQAEISLLASQGQLQDIVDKWSNIVVEGEIKITNEEKLRTQINALNKYAEAQQSRLSVLDISKGLVDQVKNTARQQEDLDRQRFDLVESYERSIADIRLGVEKQITQERLENISKENQLFSAQGDIRLQQLKNANADLKDSMFGNEFGQQLADIVSEFTEKQLSAENEIANRKRNLALELERKDVQVEEFKLGVAKQVSDLNLSTEKQVAQIRLSTLRQNQDYDQKRFEFEKRLAVTRLQSEILIAKQKRAEAIEQLKQEKDPGRINLLSSQAQIFTDLERQIPDFIRQIEQSVGPRKLSFGLPAIGGSVSTAGYESLAAKGKQLSQDLEVLQSQFDGLVRKGDIKNFSSQLNALADQGVARLSTELDDLRATIDGTEMQRSFGRIADSFASIKGSKGVIESVLSGPIQVLIELYSALSIENKKLADSLEFVNEVTRNHSEAISAAKTEINSLLSGTTEYEKTLFNLKSRGLSPATEEFQRLIQSAQEVDRLNQKVAVINTLKTAGTELSLSMRQLIEDFVELGDASEAALRFSEEMGKKGMKLALDIAFKPIEESMQQGLITFAEKLGFDVKPESQKQLEAISAIKSSVDTIKQEISQFLAKVPSVSVSENLTTKQRDFIRDQINQAMGIDTSPVQKNQPAQATPDSNVQKLDVVPYTEATQAVESLNKVGQGATQLAEQASVAAQSIDANVASVAQSVQNSGKQVESVIPAWGASLGKVVTGLAGAIAGVAGISGGITQMKGGGTYGVLTGLSSIFGAIGSIAGAFGSLSSLGGAAKGFSGGYFDPMTGLGAAGPNFGFAKGGMFTNSIVSSPTLFKFADGGLARNGLMGEAGPEAIMPLTRGPGGRLGVDANGLSDAIAEARGALDEAGLNLDGQDNEEAQSANSDQNTFNNSDRKAAAATDSVKELNYVLQDSRGAIEDMKRVSRDREAAAAAVAASPDTKELYKLLAPMGKETSTTRELLGSSTGSDSAPVAGALGSDGRQGDQSDAILAARNAIADGIEINAGQVDGSASDAITSSRELVEKINNTEKAQLAAQSQEGKSALDSARSAISTDSSTKEYFNTKESSALMQARETTDSMMALTQTRQMLNSVATVNKERSVERAIEATASGPVKPIDVRYESQVINSVEYVTAEQHRKGINEAAERGRSLTLSALKNSVKARRQIGM